MNNETSVRVTAVQPKDVQVLANGQRLVNVVIDDKDYIYVDYNMFIKTGPKGVSFRLRGGWLASVNYVNDSDYIDVVSYQGSSYAALQNNTNVTPEDSSVWEKLAEKGDKGEKGDMGEKPQLMRTGRPIPIGGVNVQIYFPEGTWEIYPHPPQELD